MGGLENGGAGGMQPGVAVAHRGGVISPIPL
jgi:hypothetical protein